MGEMKKNGPRGGVPQDTVGGGRQHIRLLTLQASKTKVLLTVWLEGVEGKGGCSKDWFFASRGNVVEKTVDSEDRWGKGVGDEMKRRDGERGEGGTVFTQR